MDMEYCAAEQNLCRLRQHVLVAPSSSQAMVGALEDVARVYEHAESLARSARADQVEGELEASVALIDACAAARDVLGAMRACALDVEAAVRRRNGAAADRAARAYVLLAKRACADARSQRRRVRSRWSTCVARAFRMSARVGCEDADEATASLSSLSSKDSQDGEAALQVQRELRALGDTIQQLEEGLELLFRRLVQCRVFLLNMCSC
ncbi:hypothetical protein BAE44_0013340 [Dichanthelium oligosanthes]|uniref:Uncharacterized protein n=1 Tax=Dichanthelium oligosanthes TaxID=888268 RepID=A0A1E5VKH6_9POAL|nr:hypothetical protein BAE44_0013340 [Dichanthelium oligosanthes]